MIKEMITILLISLALIGCESDISCPSAQIVIDYQLLEKLRAKNEAYLALIEYSRLDRKESHETLGKLIAANNEMSAYRDALWFYADKDNYTREYIYNQNSTVFTDKGRIARKVFTALFDEELKRLKEEEARAKEDK